MQHATSEVQRASTSPTPRTQITAIRLLLPIMRRFQLDLSGRMPLLARHAVREPQWSSKKHCQQLLLPTTLQRFEPASNQPVKLAGVSADEFGDIGIVFACDDGGPSALFGSTPVIQIARAAGRSTDQSWIGIQEASSAKAVVMRRLLVS